jgi:hypothetical protein
MIEARRSRELWRVLVALGIRHVGEATAKDLAAELQRRVPPTSGPAWGRAVLAALRVGYRALDTSSGNRGALDLTLKKGGGSLVVVGGSPSAKFFVNDVMAARGAELRIDGVEALHLAAIARDTVSSFRATVRLPIGKYALTGRIKTRKLEAAKDDRYQGGAAIRISGGEHQMRVSGDHDWTPFTYEFQVHDPRDVELVAELRAHSGEVWFDTGSILLVRR